MYKPKKQVGTLIMLSALAGVPMFALPTTASAEVCIVQQSSTVRGTITDTQGDPVMGAIVYVVGTNKNTVSDADGKYSIAGVPNGAKVKVSYIGCKSQEVKFNGESVLDFVMEEDNTLNEVVVTAMGIQRKEKSLTYATQMVKGEDLMKVQDANLANSLEGRVSGVTITASAGGAGGASKILLRGNSSIMGNTSPLIVVDGIPMTNNTRGRDDFSSQTDFAYSSMSEGADPLSQINPDDIESINVLKGANAAALYGSAAANGVVMITTKKGKEGRIDVNFSSNVTFENPLLTPQIQNTYGANINTVAGTIGMSSWGKRLDAQTADELNYENAKIRSVAGDDISEFFRTGVTTNNSISLSGGTEKVKTYFSFANSHANGMFENNSYNRNTVAFRQTYSLFNNRLNVETSINYVQTKTRNRPGGGTVLNPLYDLYIVPRNIDMDYYKNNYVNPEGQWDAKYSHYVSLGDDNWKYVVDDPFTLKGDQQIWAFPTAGHNNPYWLINKSFSTKRDDRVYGYVSGKLDIYDGLSLQARLSIDRTRYTGEGGRYATTYNPAAMEYYGMYSQDIDNTNEIYTDYLLSYNKTFKENYSVSATAGWVGHTIKGKSQSFWGNATQFDGLNQKFPVVVNYFNQDAFNNNSTSSYGTSSNWDKAALFTAQFGWKDMVFVDGSYRRDWYRSFKQFSQRGTPNSYGYFGFGANALLHQLLKLMNPVSYLKLRASYSEVGNSIPNILYNKVTIDYFTGAITGSGYGYFANPIPEKTKSFEMGVESAFFNSALNVDLTFYNTMMCNSYLLTMIKGENTPVNTGKIRNRGLEATVSYSFHFNHDVNWRTSVNYSYNKNKIVDTYIGENGKPINLDQNINGQKVKVRYLEGGEYGDMYANDFMRDENGLIMVDDDGVPRVSKISWKFIGNMNSPHQLGWSNTISWKDLSLFFLINGRIGGKVVSFTEAELDRLGVSKRTGDARAYAEANNLYTDDGQLAMYLPDGSGRLVSIQNYYEATAGSDFLAEQYTYNATNFRLRELSLAYTFRNLLGESKNLTLSFIARNLFFIYKDAPVDPDVSLSTGNGLNAFDCFNMPSARSFGFSLKMNF